MLPKELSQVTIFTTAQLRLRGVEQEDLRRAVSDGTLKRLKRGWYTHRSPTLPAEWHRLRTLAELKDHPGTVASHHSGAAVLRLPVHRPDWNRVHLMRTDDGPAQSRAGVIIHERIGDCTAPDAALVAAQTALICPVSGLMALDHALRNDLATLADFDRWCTQLGKHAGRGHLRLVRRLADRRRESPLESRTAYVFDCWGRPIEPQFEVPGTNYRADGRIRGTRVLVECDGLGKYDEEGASVAEKVREDEIRAQQWEVVRVTTDLLDERATLAIRVRDAIVRAQRMGG